jgi:hypothetical protein
MNRPGPGRNDLRSFTEELDLTELRVRLRKISTAELERFGRAAKYVASSAASYGTLRAVGGLQLAEAQAVWRRRMKD